MIKEGYAEVKTTRLMGLDVEPDGFTFAQKENSSLDFALKKKKSKQTYVEVGLQFTLQICKL